MKTNFSIQEIINSSLKIIESKCGEGNCGGDGKNIPKTKK